MNVKTYVLSVVAVVVISVVSDMLLPSGKMKNTCRAVYSLVVILVLISPALKLFSTEFDFSDVLCNENIDIDGDFADYANSVRENLIEKSVSDELRRKGYGEPQVDVVAEMCDGTVSYKNIFVKFNKSVIIEQSQHINITEVSEIVADFLNVESGRVTVYCE